VTIARSSTCRLSRLDSTLPRRTICATFSGAANLRTRGRGLQVFLKELAIILQQSSFLYPVNY
jgi:hypothetical protein